MLLLNAVPNCETKFFTDFNTSYVVIKRYFEDQQEANEAYFNTSYVVIKHYRGWHCGGSGKFQYILCCY